MTRIFHSLRECRALLIACALLAPPAAPAAPAPVVVSSKLSSESAMISEMLRLVLNANGIGTVDRTRLGTTPVVRAALLSGAIDLYVEYTGDAAYFFHIPADPAWKDLRKGYALGARLDLAANHIVWLTPAPANNTWALAVLRGVAAAPRLGTKSDVGTMSAVLTST